MRQLIGFVLEWVLIMLSSIPKPPETALQYTVSHRPRVTRRLHLELDENGGLVIVAPRNWSKALIRKTVAQNDRQIARFLQRAKQRQAAPLQYADGGLHLYLGQPYALAVQGADSNSVCMHTSESRIVAGVRKNDPESVKTALQQWYRQQSLQVFSQRLKLVSRRAPWTRHIDVPLSVRRMKRTWGNCSSRGAVKLNVHLLKAPLEIVDSVVAHELCHLEEMNHGKRFYALLDRLNPDWQVQRAFLRTNGFRYLQE